jgi:hypothetical protein
MRMLNYAGNILAWGVVVVCAYLIYWGVRPYAIFAFYKVIGRSKQLTKPRDQYQTEELFDIYFINMLYSVVYWMLIGIFYLYLMPFKWSASLVFAGTSIGAYITMFQCIRHNTKLNTTYTTNRIQQLARYIMDLENQVNVARKMAQKSKALPKKQVIKIKTNVREVISVPEKIPFANLDDD